MINYTFMQHRDLKNLNQNMFTVQYIYISGIYIHNDNILLVYQNLKLK